MEKRHPLAAQRCPQHTGVLRGGGARHARCMPPRPGVRRMGEIFLLCHVWCDSIRDGMEHYSDLYAAPGSPPRPVAERFSPVRNGTAILLWGQGSQLAHWEQAGEFIRTAWPNFCGEQGETFINLDGALGLDEQKIRQIIEELHKKGQKAGWYAIPCNWFATLGDIPAQGTNVKMKDLFLRDDTARCCRPSMVPSPWMSPTRNGKKWPGQPSGI